MNETRIEDYGNTLVRPIPVANDRKTAFVIVDMQRREEPDQGWTQALERIRPGSTSYYCDRVEQLVVPAIQRLLAHFRQYSLPIIHVICGSDYQDYRDVPAVLRNVVRNLEDRSGISNIMWSGDPGFAIREGLEPRTGETVVCKKTWGAFSSTNLDDVLKGMSIENLIMTGVVTHACVELTAREAADRGYGTILVDDGTAAYDEQVQKTSLRGFHRTHGRVVKTVQDVVNSMNEAKTI